MTTNSTPIDSSAAGPDAPTPKTDALLFSSDGLPDIPDEQTIIHFCRQLERELAAANAREHDLANKLTVTTFALEAERKAREEAERQRDAATAAYGFTKGALEQEQLWAKEQSVRAEAAESRLRELAAIKVNPCND